MSEGIAIELQQDGKMVSFIGSISVWKRLHLSDACYTVIAQPALSVCLSEMLSNFELA